MNQSMHVSNPGYALDMALAVLTTVAVFTLPVLVMVLA